MKGKNTFTQYEIEQLKALIKERVQAPRNKQKHIRAKMRAIGFYGGDDFGIKDCQLSDFENLIESGRIKVLDYGASTPRAKKVVTTNIEPVGSNNSKIGLKPWVGENPKVLILGSLPGDESLKQQAYYCNKGNFFWRIMHNLFGESEADNRTFITSQGIALWDCICSAERSGSSDARIKSGTEVYNDIEEFLAQYPTIKTIVFNGQKAEKSFRKQRKNIDCATIRLISTSGAAAKSLKERLDNWSIIRELVK